MSTVILLFFDYFIKNLDSSKYHTDFDMEGQVNYAFIVIQKSSDWELRDKIEKMLDDNKIEFRRGLSGGGNQLRQPCFKDWNIPLDQFEVVEHVSDFSWYIGNYPSLKKEKIDKLLELLNGV